MDSLSSNSSRYCSKTLFFLFVRSYQVKKRNNSNNIKNFKYRLKHKNTRVENKEKKNNYRWYLRANLSYNTKVDILCN